MPHKCTRCETVFKDGAAIILNGCPECGWNKFLYVRDEKVEKAVSAVEPVSIAGKTADANITVPQPAAKFIREVDEILANKDVQSEIKDETEVKELKAEKKTEEIGSRVESVRILSPGQYELNLDSIMKREEIVMALKEDGTYIVHLPSVFQKKKHDHR